MTDIRKLHEMVWQTRRELGDAWPTPDPADALRFAFTEAGEAMDAWLRQNPTYRRNNAREVSVHAELADCAMMLLTAMGPDGDPCPGPVGAWSLEDFCVAVAEYMRMAADGTNVHHDLEDQLAIVVAAIAAYPGMDLTRELTARLAAIITKHGAR